MFSFHKLPQPDNYIFTYLTVLNSGSMEATSCFLVVADSKLQEKKNEFPHRIVSVIQVFLKDTFGTVSFDLSV